MSLRIISGEFKGRYISGPGRGETRPTLERVRESLFDILAYRLKGVRVLDLCSGSGALGFEALSRGAKSITFLEKDAKNVKVLHENIAELNVGLKATIIKGELPLAVGRIKGKYDVVFFDPPYSCDFVERVVKRLGQRNLLSTNAIIIVERDRRSKPLNVGGFVIDRRHRIGDAELWFMRQKSTESKQSEGE